MKGRRKAKTAKWQMKESFEVEARLILEGRSHWSSSRFLDRLPLLESEREPAGLLAGSSKRTGTSGASTAS